MLMSISEFKSKPSGVTWGKTEDNKWDFFELQAPKINFWVSNPWMSRLQNFWEFITLSEENSKEEEDSSWETSIERAIRISWFEKPLYVPQIPSLMKRKLILRKYHDFG